jgi:hypothetical protein
MDINGGQSMLGFKHSLKMIDTQHVTVAFSKKGEYF